jgi:rubrerythrin
MIDTLSVKAVGANFLYFSEVARTAQNESSQEAYEAQARREREHLLQLLHEVEKQVVVTSYALAYEAAVDTSGNGRYGRLEKELDRLEYLQDDLNAYLGGKKPDAVDPVVKAREELVALATRARVAAASRRFTGNRSRGSYDGGVIRELVERGVAKEPRHAIHVLNLSEGLNEGWSNEELVYWGICYRKARGNGERKEVAVAVANKALTVG